MDANDLSMSWNRFAHLPMDEQDKLFEIQVRHIGEKGKEAVIAAGWALYLGAELEPRAIGAPLSDDEINQIAIAIDKVPFVHSIIQTSPRIL